MPRFRNMLKHIGRAPEVRYCGPEPSAATATGYYKVHDKDVADIIK